MAATTGAEGVDRAVFGAETDTAMAGLCPVVVIPLVGAFAVSVSVAVFAATGGSDFGDGIDAADVSIAISAASARSRWGLLALLYAPRNRGEVGITGLLISFAGRTG